MITRSVLFGAAVALAAALAQSAVAQSGEPAAQTPSVTPRPAPVRSFVTNWPTGKKLVALTYDDGPHPTITPKLIDLLKRKNVPATFYVLGKQMEAYPATARLLHENGFEIVNHTFNHDQLTKLSEAKVRSELTKTNDLITAVTGIPVTHMRPPYGARNARVDAVCRDLGMQIVLWDVDTEDWRKRSAAQMTNTILKGTGDGSIILFHDRYQASLDSTETVIDSLRARGYTFVTVGQLLSTPRAGTAAETKSESATTPPAQGASKQ